MCWPTVKRRKVMRTTMNMTMPKRIVLRIKTKITIIIKEAFKNYLANFVR